MQEKINKLLEERNQYVAMIMNLKSENENLRNELVFQKLKFLMDKEKEKYHFDNVVSELSQGKDFLDTTCHACFKNIINECGYENVVNYLKEHIKKLEKGD